MTKMFLLLPLFTLIFLSSSLPSYATAHLKTKAKVIYGEDNRVDVDKSENAEFRQWSRSTAAMIGLSALTADERGQYQVKGTTMVDRGFCPSERFSKQLLAARCSGFLVAPDLLATAGHCVRSQRDCQGYAWVFDFKWNEEGQKILPLPAASVRKCKEIVERNYDYSTGDDYALIRLTEAVTDRPPLEFRREGQVEVGRDLVVIGHPTGLPTKIADGAQVRSNNKKAYFVANLDTYGGNSGSAVFDARTGVVEGILVRGESDYVWDSANRCRKSKQCTDLGCRGEDVTRITNIKALKAGETL